MSEAELHMMCQRMHQGRSNKARRGELFTHVPIGYVRDESGQAVLDPDEEVHSVVHLVFDKFDELGSAGAVLRYLVAHEVRIGIRRHDGPTRGQLEWRRPCGNTLLSMLHHPIYAGTYSHGRRPCPYPHQTCVLSLVATNTNTFNFSQPRHIVIHPGSPSLLRPRKPPSLATSR